MAIVKGKCEGEATAKFKGTSRGERSKIQGSKCEQEIAKVMHQKRKCRAVGGGNANEQKAKAQKAKERRRKLTYY